MRAACCPPALLTKPRQRKPVQNALIESVNVRLLRSMPEASRQFPSLKWPSRENPTAGVNLGLDKPWGKVTGSKNGSTPCLTGT
jgi:hypothetical protein